MSHFDFKIISDFMYEMAGSDNWNDLSSFTRNMTDQRNVFVWNIGRTLTGAWESDTYPNLKSILYSLLGLPYKFEIDYKFPDISAHQFESLYRDKGDPSHTPFGNFQYQIGEIMREYETNLKLEADKKLTEVVKSDYSSSNLVSITEKTEILKPIPNIIWILGLGLATYLLINNNKVKVVESHANLHVYNPTV